MFKQTQRIILLVLLSVGVLLTAVMFVIGETNQSAASQVPATAAASQPERYFYSAQNLPNAGANTSVFTLLFFSDSWDSYSIRMRELLQAKLGSNDSLQVVELDLDDNRDQGQVWNVKISPAVILLDREGKELGRITNPIALDLDQLVGRFVVLK